MTPALRIEPYREALHYAVLCAWWIGHGQEPEPEAVLPGDTRPGAGFVAVTPEGAPLAAAWVYETGTLLWLGPHNLVVNPALHEAEGGKALASAATDAVILAVIDHVREAGGGVLRTDTTDFTVAARGRKNGLMLIGKAFMLSRVLSAKEG
jgi:hypothetical protein